MTTIVLDGQTLTGRNICEHCGTVHLALCSPPDPKADCDCLCHKARKLALARNVSGGNK